MHNLGIEENDPYRWLKTKEIAVTEKYTIENARASIQTLFSFRDLKNISVADLEGINKRLKEWFDMHKDVFFETSDYMFELTYDKNTFRKLFYEALGFMGRNFRYRDDDRFLPLEYFINRYVSEQSLDLEHYFLHNTLLKLAGTNNSLVIIDTKGKISRKKCILTKIKPVELTKSMKEKIKANLKLLNKEGKLLKTDGEYGTIIA
jgi:hypothetical protein